MNFYDCVKKSSRRDFIYFVYPCSKGSIWGYTGKYPNLLCIIDFANIQRYFDKYIQAVFVDDWFLLKKTWN